MYKPRKWLMINIRGCCRSLKVLSIQCCQNFPFFSRRGRAQWRGVRMGVLWRAGNTSTIFDAGIDVVYRFIWRSRKLLCLILGLYSQSGQTSYHKISWRLEAAKFGLRPFQSLWNLTGTSAAAHSILQLRDFTRFGGKTPYRLVYRGPVL